MKGADAQPFHSRENAATSADLSSHPFKRQICRSIATFAAEIAAAAGGQISGREEPNE